MGSESPPTNYWCLNSLSSQFQDFHHQVAQFRQVVFYLEVPVLQVEQALLKVLRHVFEIVLHLPAHRFHLLRLPFLMLSVFDSFVLNFSAFLSMLILSLTLKKREQEET